MSVAIDNISARYIQNDAALQEMLYYGDCSSWWQAIYSDNYNMPAFAPVAKTYHGRAVEYYYTVADLTAAIKENRYLDVEILRPLNEDLTVLSSATIFTNGFDARINLPSDSTLTQDGDTYIVVAPQRPDDYQYELEYRLNDDGNSYTVVGAGAYVNSNLVIPATYNSLPITSIGKNAFICRYELKQVTIPSSVITIEASAFQYCANLERVITGDGVTEIGLSAFNACSSLKDIRLSSSLSVIGDQAFRNCGALERLYLPVSLTKIGAKFIEGCDYVIIYYEGTQTQLRFVEINSDNQRYNYAVKYYNESYPDVITEVL